MQSTMEEIIREKVINLLDSPTKFKDELKFVETILSELKKEYEITEILAELIKEEQISVESLDFLILHIIGELKLQRAGIRNGIPKISYQVLRAIEDGQTTGLKELIENHRIMVLYHSLMCIAARFNNVEAIKIMLEAGFSPDTRFWSNGVTPLHEAASHGSIKAAEILLDAGANLEEGNNNHSATPLLAAISGSRFADKVKQTEMVKFLIDRGANIHAEYTLGKRTKLNALKLAVLEQYHGLVAFFRTKGVAWIGDTTPADHTPKTSRLQFLSKYFKSYPLPLGLTEIVPDSVPMLVHVFPPAKRKRKTTIFVTSGLSDYMLTVSDENTEFAFAEYFIEVPGHWDLSKESLDKDQFFWPIRWLKTIGRYPHENETFYGMEQIITNSKIPSLSTPDDKYCCAKVQRIPALDYVIPQDGRFTIFYQITPLEQKIEDKTTN
jgi:hypothetical protein